MSVAVRRDQRMRVPEFIDMIRPLPDEERWELIEGRPELMAPQSERHQLIVYRLLRQLGDLAEKRGCRALPGLGVLSDSRDDYAPISDIVVRCGPLLKDGYARDPILVAEVLSPSTMRNDRLDKLNFYRTVESLSTILIVFSAEVRIEAWQREEGEWQVRDVGAGGAVALPELGGEIKLDEVYAGLSG
jgi:Uma2 family endonuclease